MKQPKKVESEHEATALKTNTAKGAVAVSSSPSHDTKTTSVPNSKNDQLTEKKTEASVPSLMASRNSLSTKEEEMELQVSRVENKTFGLPNEQDGSQAASAKDIKERSSAEENVPVQNKEHVQRIGTGGMAESLSDPNKTVSDPVQKQKVENDQGVSKGKEGADGSLKVPGKVSDNLESSKKDNAVVVSGKTGEVAANIPKVREQEEQKVGHKMEVPFGAEKSATVGQAAAPSDMSERKPGGKSQEPPMASTKTTIPHTNEAEKEVISFSRTLEKGTTVVEGDGGKINSGTISKPSISQENEVNLAGENSKSSHGHGNMNKSVLVQEDVVDNTPNSTKRKVEVEKVIPPQRNPVSEENIIENKAGENKVGASAIQSTSQSIESTQAGKPQVLHPAARNLGTPAQPPKLSNENRENEMREAPSDGTAKDSDGASTLEQGTEKRHTLIPPVAIAGLGTPEKTNEANLRTESSAANQDPPKEQEIKKKEVTGQVASMIPKRAETEEGRPATAGDKATKEDTVLDKKVESDDRTLLVQPVEQDSASLSLVTDNALKGETRALGEDGPGSKKPREIELKDEPVAKKALQGDASRDQTGSKTDEKEELVKTGHLGTGTPTIEGSRESNGMKKKESLSNRSSEETPAKTGAASLTREIIKSKEGTGNHPHGNEESRIRVGATPQSVATKQETTTSEEEDGKVAMDIDGAPVDTSALGQGEISGYKESEGAHAPIKRTAPPPLGEATSSHPKTLSSKEQSKNYRDSMKIGSVPKTSKVVLAAKVKTDDGVALMENEHVTGAAKLARNPEESVVLSDPATVQGPEILREESIKIAGLLKEDEARKPDLAFPEKQSQNENATDAFSSQDVKTQTAQPDERDTSKEQKNSPTSDAKSSGNRVEEAQKEKEKSKPADDVVRPKDLSTKNTATSNLVRKTAGSPEVSGQQDALSTSKQTGIRDKAELTTQELSKNLKRKEDEPQLEDVDVGFIEPDKVGVKGQKESIPPTGVENRGQSKVAFAASVESKVLQHEGTSQSVVKRSEAPEITRGDTADKRETVSGASSRVDAKEQDCDRTEVVNQLSGDHEKSTLNIEKVEIGQSKHESEGKRAKSIAEGRTKEAPKEAALNDSALLSKNDSKAVIDSKAEEESKPNEPKLGVRMAEQQADTIETHEQIQPVASKKGVAPVSVDVSSTGKKQPSSSDPENLQGTGGKTKAQPQATSGPKAEGADLEAKEPSVVESQDVSITIGPSVPDEGDSNFKRDAESHEKRQLEDPTSERESKRIKTEDKAPSSKPVVVVSFEKMKLRLYSEGALAHGLHDYDRKFSEYWDGIRMRFDGGNNPANIEVSTFRINKFLKTRKLRKIHNKMIKSLLERCHMSKVPYDKISELVPSSWHGRIKQGSGEFKPKQLPTVPNKLLKEEKKPAVLMDKVAYLPTIGGAAAKPYHHKQKAQSSIRLPGSLSIDPELKYLAQSASMKVSDSTVWLVVASAKEYATKILKGCVALKKAVNNGKIKRPISHSTQLARPEKKTKRETSNADLPVHARRITPIDMQAFVSTMPLAAPRPGGSLSRVTHERIMVATNETSIPPFGSEFYKLKEFMWEKIAPSYSAPISFQLSPSPQPGASSNGGGESRQKLVVGGLGRGAKDLAALKMRTSSTKADGAPLTDTSESGRLSAGSRNSNPSATQNQQPSTSTSNETNHHAAAGQSDSPGSEDVGGRPRGKGFSIKDLAAMRARSAGPE